MNNPTGSWSGTRRSFPKRTRNRVLRRDPECRLAIPGVCTTTSTEVDHIVGHADALAAGWDPSDIDDEANAQGVCSPCHRIKTRAEQQRGRQRTATKPKRQRAAEQHPGLVNSDDT